MLAAIRQFSKSWVAILLFSLLLISLMVWGGMSDMFKNQVSTGVVSVGKHQISAAEFENRFNQQVEEFSRQQGQPVDKQALIKQGAYRQMVSDLASQYSLIEAVMRMGIRPSPAQVAERISQIPAFLDPVTGKLDKKQYAQTLAQNHIQVRDFEQGLNDEIAFQHLGAGLQAGLMAPRIYGALFAVSQMENRSWSSFTLDPSKVPVPAKPTDAQLTAFMNENAAALRKPELRELSFVRFSTKAMQDTVAVDPAELKKLYDFRKDSPEMSKPELRTFVQIPAKTDAQAQTAAQRLAKGEDPAAIAKSLGVEPITSADKPKTAISDPAVASAVFSLPAGQASGPIKGQLGLAVVKVIEIKPGIVMPFEQAKPQLEQRLKHDAAQKKAYAAAEAFEKAHAGGQSFAEAAKAAGATVTTTGPVAQNGRTLKGEMATGVTEPLITAAFGLNQGEDSDTQDEGQGEYFVVHVDKVTPSALPSLEEIRADLTDRFMMRETAKALKAKADELAARVRKGEALDAVAASVGASVSHAVNVDKQAAQQQAQTVGVELLQGVFGAKRGEVVVTPGQKLTMVVTRVDNIGTGAVEQLAPVAETARSRANNTLAAEVLQQMQAASRKIMNPKVDMAKAAQALGASPEEAAPPPAKKAKG